LSNDTPSFVAVLEYIKGQMKRRTGKTSKRAIALLDGVTRQIIEVLPPFSEIRSNLWFTFGLHADRQYRKNFKKNLMNEIIFSYKKTS